ncbi:unnamed protein product, partial [Meganyctiphanes norvegica]
VKGEEVPDNVILLPSEGQQVNPEEFESHVLRANKAIQRAWDHMAHSSYQQACREFQNALTSIDSIMRVQISSARISPSTRDRLLAHQNNLMYKRKEVLEGFSDAQAACRGSAVSSSPTPGAPPSYDDVLRESQAEVNRHSHTIQNSPLQSQRTASVASNRNSQIRDPQSPPHPTPRQRQASVPSNRHSLVRPTQSPPIPPSPKDRNIHAPQSPTHHILGENQVHIAATSVPVSPHKHPRSRRSQNQPREAHRENQPSVKPRRHTQPLEPTQIQNSISQPSSITSKSSIASTHNNFHSAALRSLDFFPDRKSEDSNSHEAKEIFPWQTKQIQSPVESSAIYPKLQSIDGKGQCLEENRVDPTEKKSLSNEPASAILNSKDSSTKISDDSIGTNLLIPFVDDADNSLNYEINNKDNKASPNSSLNTENNNRKTISNDIIIDPFSSTDPFKNEYFKTSVEDIFSDLDTEVNIKQEDNPDEIFSDIDEKDNINEECSHINQHEFSDNFTDIDIKQTSTPVRYKQQNQGELTQENPEQIFNHSNDTSEVGITNEPDYTFSDLVMSRLNENVEKEMISKPINSISSGNKRVSPKRSESVGNLLLSFNTPHAPVGARPSVLSMFDPLGTPKSLNVSNCTKKSFRHSMDCSSSLLEKHSTSMGNLPVTITDIDNIEENDQNYLNYIGEEDSNYSSHSNSQEDIPEAYITNSEPPPYTVYPNDPHVDDRYGTPNKDIVSVTYDDAIPKINVGRSSFYPDLDNIKGCKLNCGKCPECQQPAEASTRYVPKPQSSSGIDYLRIREGIKIFFIFENGKVTSPWKKPVLSISQENAYEGNSDGMVLKVGERLWSCHLNKKVTIVLRAESRAYMFAAKQCSTIHDSVSKQQKCSAIAITLPSNLRKNYEERLTYLLKNNCRLEEEEIKGITREVETAVSKGAASASAKVTQILPGSSQTNNSFVRRNSVRALRKAGKVMTKKLNTIAERSSIPDMELPKEYAILQEAARHLQICRSKKDVEYL